MKTNLFKKLMMPMAVVVLGLSGAFATMSMKSSTALADKMGFRFVSNLDQCHATKLCTTDPGVVCKSGAITLWGKEVNDNDPDEPCIIELHERQ